MKTIILILIAIVCISCSPPQKIVYFKHVNITVEEAKHHSHGKKRRASPHYIPVKGDSTSHYLIEKYSKLYTEINKPKDNGILFWIIDYLVIIILLDLPSIL